MERVLGHERPKEFFRGVLRRRRLASTFLFVGREGIGKRLFANELAKLLLCKSADEERLHPCGVCESCRLIEAGTHPDLLLIGPPPGKNNLPIELFVGPKEKRGRQGLCHDLAIKPMVGNRRVAVIDNADGLGVESANSLLKTLEEPPPNSVLILVGQSLGRQLPTIRSRAQIVRFSPLPAEIVQQVLTADPFSLPAEQAGELSRASAGSVTRALALNDSQLQEARGLVGQALEASAFDANRFNQLLDETIKSVGTEAAARRDCLLGLVEHVIQKLHLRVRTDPLNSRRLVRAIDCSIEAEEAISRNANLSAVTAWWSQSLWRAIQV